MTLTDKEFAEWYRDPVTQHFLVGLHTKREEVKEAWSKQAYVDPDSPQRSAHLNLYALASIDVLSQVIELVEETRPQNQGEV